MGTSRAGRMALALLGVAAALAGLGLWLERGGLAPGTGRLLAAFGEAALVGGLADWFAVTALFSRPLGFPFHTAIVPRKRRELARAAAQWVEEDLLPRARLLQQVQHLDFVERLHALAASAPVRREVRAALRTVLGDAARDVDAAAAARLLGDLVAAQLARADLRGHVASLLDAAHENDWLWPLAREWSGRLEAWAAAPEGLEAIRAAVRRTWGYYRKEGSWLARAVKAFAEVTPLVDLDKAASSLRALLVEFARAQREEGSEAHRLVRGQMAGLGERLRRDDALYERLRRILLRVADGPSLAAALRPVLEALRSHAAADLAGEASRLAEHAAACLEGWIASVHGDPAARARANAWLVRLAEHLIEKHHSAIGRMVQEQIDRLRDDQLVGMIKAKTGDDLDWIRINGAIVGGGIGVILHFLRELAA